MIPCFVIAREKLRLSLVTIFVHFLLVLLFYVYPVVRASQSVPQCHEDERSALLELKQSFGRNSKGTCFDSWDPAEGEESGNCCVWGRIECDGHSGHVIGLDLSDCGLPTDLNSNSSIFRLTELERLDLEGNNFMGSPIPSTIGNLQRLKVLNLSWCEFKGQVPPEILRLANLSSLDLSSNFDLELKKPDMRDLAESLTKLEELHLDWVNISAPLPDALGLCTSLKSLKLADCGLYGEFPNAIWKLPNLQELDLSSNKGLSGQLPASLESYESLRELDLSNCSFEGMIPATVSNWTKLSILRLNSNGFHGKLPSFRGLKQLTELLLNDNMLSGEIPSSLGELNLLSSLCLDRNQFTGPIPSSIGNLTQLSELDLSHNQLTGPIPSSIGNLTELSRLYLGHNQLTGPIPSSIGNLTELSRLYLSHNQLTGPIPSSIGDLTQLSRLYLGHNQLTGPIPSSIGNLTQLDTLLLTSNNLTGPIPPSIRNLTQLLILKMASNRLSGQIPSFTGNISYLDLSHNQFTSIVQLDSLLDNTVIDLSFNKLQGPLPVPSRQTKFYRVSNNKFSGEIPPPICNLSYPRVLDLANNYLTGSIPECLRNLSITLGILSLRDNKLSGFVPRLFKRGCRLNMIDLSNNQLEGPLPHSLANCKGLEFLNFGNNLIDDKFPSRLGSLPNLIVLILQSNRFHGQIEKPLNSDPGFPKLQIIDLSHNNFQGSLPSNYFKHWRAMRVSNLNKSGYLGETFEVDHMLGSFGYSSNQYYDYSMVIFNKGTYMLYPKIFHAVTVINLSYNNFSGGIPSSLGSLQGLRLLNLSNNLLTGCIPPVLSNLTQLEALDLSRNMLSAEVPYQLTGLKFLSFFNLSYNHLSGSIPRGPQFVTFQNTSYMGNPGLCGYPLSKKCGDDKEAPPPPPHQNGRHDVDALLEFDWKIILPGFACGIVIGVVLGQGVPIGRDNWFVRKFGRRYRRRRR